MEVQASWFASMMIPNFMVIYQIIIVESPKIKKKNVSVMVVLEKKSKDDQSH